MTRSIGRARKLLPFPAPARTYNFTTAVIGQTEAAQSAALTLAQAGFEVLMFGSAKAPLGADSRPSAHLCLRRCHRSWRRQRHPGQFSSAHPLRRRPCASFPWAGWFWGKNHRNIAIYRQHEQLPVVKVQAGMQKAHMEGIPFIYPGTTSISGLFLADPPNIQISKRTKGEAAAVLAAAAMPRGPRQSRGLSVVIDESLCRGCGRCLKACVYQAVSLKRHLDGGVTALWMTPCARGAATASRSVRPMPPTAPSAIRPTWNRPWKSC
jgi:ferredoxin